MDRLNVDVNAYVPRWVRTALGKPRFSNGEPAVESGAAAVLLLDIAGFVELTNQFARRGPVGAEEISNLLNRCFGSLTDIVHDHGGDVIAFAGDSILAMWGHAFAIDQASHLAAQCGLALRKAMSEQAMSGDHRLRQRISAETGEIYCCKLGGFGGQWFFVVAGTPFERLGEAYRKARVGDLVLCGELWRAIEASCEGTIADGLFVLDGLSGRRLQPTHAFQPIECNEQVEVARAKSCR